MNKTIIKIKLFALSFLISSSLIAQQKLTKVSQSINVKKDVTIDLNTTHTNIVFDTWNKNVVEIEAYIEDKKLSKEELQEVLRSWHLDIDATNDLVTIRSKGGSSNLWAYRTKSHSDDDAVRAMLKELKFEIADFPDMNFDFNIEMPEIPDMPELPELPKLPEGANNIQFDYEAYKKDADRYLAEYNKKFESLYGEDYLKKMEAWGEKFGKEWGEKYGKQMEKWVQKMEGKLNSDEFAKKMEDWGEKFGEDYEEKMEAWGEQYAAQMEKQADRIEAELERKREHENRGKERSILADERRKNIEKLFDDKPNTNVKKTIKIKMPKGAKLKVNVRHGEIELAANINNLKAEISHSKFTAQSIDGSSTSINAFYSPVHVANWNLGELNLHYVNDAILKDVKQLVLNSISSNLDIENLTGSAVIDANIGDLKILNITDAFSNLNMILQNNDVVIKLPKADYYLQYKGSRAKFSYPSKTSTDNASNFSIGNLSSGKSIVVNAKYSNVDMH